MVECTVPLDYVFGSLTDPTRRDILQRLMRGEQPVGDLAKPYDMSLAAVSKHLKILEKAQLISKRRRGKQTIVSVQVSAVKEAADYLRQFEQLWNQRLDNLEQYLDKEA